MKSFIPKEAASIVQAHKSHRRYVVILACLGTAVALATMLGLRMYGRAMVKEVRVFDCAYTPHQHTEDCYVEAGGQKVLSCGQADYVVHVHNLDCYDEDTGTLVCQLPEVKEHEHTEECRQTVRELTCGQPEVPAHTHDETCIAEVRTLTCGREEAAPHTHTDACYTTGAPVLVCALPEGEGHTHTEVCYTVTSEITCGLAEGEDHTHTEACYTVTNELTCTLPEGEGHTHTDDCYTETETLTCAEPAVKLHTHTDACWTPLAELEEMTDGELAVLDLTREGLAALRTREVPVENDIETEETDGEAEETDGEPGETDGEPATEIQALTCGLPEVLEHTHTVAGGCFHYETVENADAVAPADETKTGDGETAAPICGLEEHAHTDACYDGTGSLTCGLAEHTHSEECYAPAEETGAWTGGEDGIATPETAEPVLTCGLEEHTHTAACYTDEKILICELKEDEGHTHNDNCYYIQKALTCGLEEHTHSEDCYGPAGEDLPESCYDAHGKLICGKESHIHTEECYELQMVATCGLEEGPGHTHTDACYDETGALICGLEESEPHTHTDECYEERLVPVCGLEEHTHVLPEGAKFTASCEVDGLLVTASYSLDAQIPADAEFRVTKIEPAYENDAEYAQRVDAAREAVENNAEEEIDVNTMTLLNIGFYLQDGSEYQPASPVSITVKYLNAAEHGVAEGDSVGVVHFADDDSVEVLAGTDLDADAATSFEADSFSTYGIGTYNISSINADNSTGNAGIMTIAGNVYSKFAHNKRIDYLGDNGTYGNGKDNDNVDTNADDGTNKVTDDLYRIYLDMEGKSEPSNVLFIVDRSSSMRSSMEGSAASDKALYDMLSGDDGIIAQFMKRNEGKSGAKNKSYMAMVWYGGMYPGFESEDYYIKNNDKEINRETSTKPDGMNPNVIGVHKQSNYKEDAGVVFDWTTTYRANMISMGNDPALGQIGGIIRTYKDNKGNTTRTETVEGTNYCAGFMAAADMLKSTNLPPAARNRETIVVFLSDGLPTYFYRGSDYNTRGEIKRYGEAYEDKSALCRDGLRRMNEDNKPETIGPKYGFFTNTLDFYEKFQAEFENYFGEGNFKFVTVGINTNNAVAYRYARDPDELYSVDKYFGGRFYKYLTNKEKSEMKFEPRGALLDDMSKLSGSGGVLNAANAAELEQRLREIVFPTSVTITDVLSEDVKFYKGNPDVLVTATSKTSGEVISLWGGTVQADGIHYGTAKHKNKLDDIGPVVDEEKNVAVNGKTVTLTFDDGYSLSDDYIYTLSFNVKLTEAAYDHFAACYNESDKSYGSYKGDANTDYGGNETSSEKGGLFSNSEAYVDYKIDGQSGHLTYPHPVVQAWGTMFRVHKVDKDSNQSLPGMLFKLCKMTDSDNDGEPDKDDKGYPLIASEIQPVSGSTGQLVPTTESANGFYKTDANGDIVWGKLEHGTYYLYENIQQGYVGYVEGGSNSKLVATFIVAKGHISSYTVEVKPQSGIEAAWSEEVARVAAKKNHTPNTVYKDNDVTLTVTNKSDGNLLRIKKVDAVGHALTGAKFTLKDSEGNAVPGVFEVTGADGLIYSGRLLAGTYTLEETAAPDGYELLKSAITFTVSNDGIKPKEPVKPAGVEFGTTKDGEGYLTVTITNTPKAIGLQIKKVAAHNTETPLPGAEFELWEADGYAGWSKDTDGSWKTTGDKLASGTTGQDGLLHFDCTLLPGHKYIVKETKAPDGYNLLQGSIRIRVESDGKVYYTKNDMVADNAFEELMDADSDLVYEIDVPNTSGYELPKTGGIGTQWYTLGGLLVLAMALAYKVFAGRRRGNA